MKFGYRACVPLMVVSFISANAFFGRANTGDNQVTGRVVSCNA